MLQPKAGKSHLFGQADRILGKTATAVAVATGAGLMCEPQQAQAAFIVYSGTVNIPIPVNTAGVYLNVVTGVSNGNPASAPGWDINPWNTSTLSWFNPGAPSGGVYVTGNGSSTTLVDNLSKGTLINFSQIFGSGTSESTGSTAFNLNSSNNYVGFRFQNEATGNTTNYGWVQVSLGSSLTDPARSIIGYAYEGTGDSILAGQTEAVPAPASIVVLAGGAAGLAAFRRRRQVQANQTAA